MFSLENNGRYFLFRREIEFLTEGERVFRVGERMEQGDGDAPAFSRGKIAARMEEGGDGAEPPEAVRRREHDFAAPNRIVRTVSGAVEAHADDGLQMIVFCHDGKHMGVMMLHFDDGDAKGFGKAARLVARMQVGGDEVGRYAEEPFHARQRLTQHLHRAQIAHVADVGGRVEECIFGKTECVLDFTADAEDRTLKIGGNHQGKRRIAAAPPNHVRCAFIEIHDAVVGTQADFSVVRQDEVGDG